MKKKINFLVFLLLLISSWVFAQTPANPTQAPAGQPANQQPVANPPATNQSNKGDILVNAVSADSRVDLTKFPKVMLDNFENAELWTSQMPEDSGLVELQKREGGPQGVKGDGNTGILGVKVSFFKRGSVVVSLLPTKPMQIDDVVKGFSIWLVGRGVDHKLEVVTKHPVTGVVGVSQLGSFSHLGWKQFTTAFPDIFRVVDYQNYFRRTPEQGEDLNNYFQPDDLKYFVNMISKEGKKGGIVVEALLINADPKEAKGVFYTYLDNFEVYVDKDITDVLDKIDNVIDNW